MASEPTQLPRPAESAEGARELHLPSPTPWPILMALGLTLVAAGLVSNLRLSEGGGLLALIAAAGWFLQVLPQERHDRFAVNVRAVEYSSPRRLASRPHAGVLAGSARLPVAGHPIATGVQAGLAGGLAMAVVAAIYGLVTSAGLWYAPNLIGAVVFARVRIGMPELEAFHPGLLALALALHLTTCILVGLFYSAFLPLLARERSRQPGAVAALPLLVVAGIVAPLAWSGLLRGVLDVIDPVLFAHINWLWFLVAQMAFGWVAGAVVLRLAWPLRAGGSGGGTAGDRGVPGG